MIDVATPRIADIEADIDELVHQDPATAEIIAIIEDIPRCGCIATVTLMPEIGTLTGRQAASLAPHPHQSGQRDGYRRTRGRRPEVCPKGTQNDKRALFMAALAARNHNPTLKAVYDRLVQNGKKPLVALMRKLITIINARVRDAHHQPITQLS